MFQHTRNLRADVQNLKRDDSGWADNLGFVADFFAQERLANWRIGGCATFQIFVVEFFGRDNRIDAFFARSGAIEYSMRAKPLRFSRHFGNYCAKIIRNDSRFLF